MELDSSIIKIYNQFNMQYGTSGNILEFVMPLMDESKYYLWKEEIRLASTQEIIDLRYIT